MPPDLRHTATVVTGFVCHRSAHLSRGRTAKVYSERIWYTDGVTDTSWVSLLFSLFKPTPVSGEAWDFEIHKDVDSAIAHNLVRDDLGFLSGGLLSVQNFFETRQHPNQPIADSQFAHSGRRFVRWFSAMRARISFPGGEVKRQKGSPIRHTMIRCMQWTWSSIRMSLTLKCSRLSHNS